MLVMKPETKMIKNEFRKKMMLEALEKTLGVIAPAAKMCKVNRIQHYQWLKEDPEYKQSVEDQMERTLDFAETNLYKQIESGQTQATIFFLKTRGKERGYVEHSVIDHTSSDGSLKPTVIELVPQPELTVEGEVITEYE